ncbi:DUF1345 domain-containing protein [Microlunatus parietis]|uniref:Putative membrane protein n=1 Tax=Microlunatus parietis TaxID=682979 RepID=A0A7Y9I9V4_9ACTN|nr:DUF1345 domain-containing protein [Microlunatus parietis]NYE72867.1 putative membrane protein [Microlunatus parietis]
MRKLKYLPALILDIALIGLSFTLVFLDDLLVLLAWTAAAIGYLLIRIRRVRRVRLGRDPDWRDALMPRRLGYVFTLLISLTGIGAGLSIVIGDRFGEAMFGGLPPDAAKLFAVPAVIISWAILHFGYAERYAHLYQDALPQRILDFPEQPDPTLVEFAYFAFTVGVSFAVSDVETRSTPIRAQLLAHAVLSFLYNTATLGIAIGVITGG